MLYLYFIFYFIEYTAILYKRIVIIRVQLITLIINIIALNL